MDNPGAVIQAISELGGDWLHVMNNIKDWVQMVSLTHLPFSKLLIRYIVPISVSCLIIYKIMAHLGGVGYVCQTLLKSGGINF